LLIDYLAIGHICADLQPDGSTQLGGTALFAALAAHKLGLRVAIVTACAPDLDLSSIPDDVQVLRQPSPATTIFENRYHAGGRTQLVHARAAPIDVSATPDEWLAAPIVHLAPILDDVSPAAAPRFPAALVGVTPQGLLRHVEPSKLVTTEPAALLRQPWASVGAVVLSEEDVQLDERPVRALAQQLPLVVLTRAERGATVLVDGLAIDVPAFAADVVDPTGAGDVFAAAYFMALCRGSDPIAAARWACAAAACAIEGIGTSTLPTAALVEQRLQSSR
jgi:sugar/nucleoside kinase (ribokinase family)